MTNYPPFDLVMVIDDNPIDRYLCSAVVKKSHWATKFLEFDMAQKALDYLLENADKPENIPQIVFLDINMPGMNGFQFLEEAAKLPIVIERTCCIVMLTSSFDHEDKSKSESNPIVKDYLNKPLNQAKLNEVELVFKKQFGIAQ